MRARRSIETVTAASRSAADGARATIELNRPETLNAWNQQFGDDLLAAVRSAAADDDGPRGRRSPAPAAASPPAPTSRPASTPDARRPSRTSATALTERYHPIIDGHPRDAQAGASRRSTAPRSGIGCSLALACDLIVAAESAYFLLAFVNIGLVPDGGSSLSRPRRASGFARAAEMAMLGERVPAPAGARVGPDQPRRARRGASSDEVDALADRLAAGPTALLRGHQAPAQRLAVRAHGASSSSSRPTIQQEMAALAATSSRASRRSSRSARRASRAPERRTAGRRRAAALYPSSAAPCGRRLRRSPARAARALVVALLAAAGRPCRAAVPGVGRLAERRQHRHALRDRLRHRAGHLRRRRGRAPLLAVQVPGPPRAAAPPRSTATRGWRSAGRSAPRVILVFITVVTFIKLPRHQEPAGVADRRQRATRSRATALLRRDRPAAAAQGRRRCTSGRRPAVRVALPVPRQGASRLRLHGHGRARSA